MCRKVTEPVSQLPFRTKRFRRVPRLRNHGSQHDDTTIVLRRMDVSARRRHDEIPEGYRPVIALQHQRTG